MLSIRAVSLNLNRFAIRPLQSIYLMLHQGGNSMKTRYEMYVSGVQQPPHNRRSPTHLTATLAETSENGQQ